jgi:membrane-bound lytic murein transglycosylase B
VILLARRFRARALLTAAVALLAALPLIAATAAPARADSAAAAEKRAKEILAKVAAIQKQVDAALTAYDAALGGLAGAVNGNVVADTALNSATQAAAEADAQAAARVRAIYRSGGPMGLYASVVEGTSPSDVLSRVRVVQRLVATDYHARATERRVLGQATVHAADARSIANNRAKAAGLVDKVAVQLEDLLAEQQTLLNETKATASRLRAAEDALRAAQSSYSAITSERIRTIQPSAMSPEYFDLYHAAAATCPGLSWTVLAAIGQVETGHGRNTNTSSAGAQGPMQFMPATFAAYGVDGNNDGVTDIFNPADAIYSAAHYLCANGAGRGNLSGAIFRYNHAGWYVQLVLTLAQRYG